MSTVPITGTTFPPTVRDDVAGPGQVRSLPGQTIGRIGAELLCVPRYVVRYSIVVLALLGLLSLWEVQGDSHVPTMVPWMGTEKEPNRFSGLCCAEPGVSDGERWGVLSGSLAILDDVNPQVANWVREKHDCGGLVFSDRHTGQHDNQASLAKYDHIGRKLIVQRALFEEKDGEIAAILCHEYRHSRQNVGKLIRCILSFVFTADGDRSILENDAQLYEHEARLAIFRP